MDARARHGRWVREGSTVTLFGLEGPGRGPAESGAAELELETLARPTLRRGSSGSVVRDLQTKLRSLGFDPGPIDGAFGPGTEAAVRSFQASHGLEADGIVGARSWSALGSAPASSIHPATAPPPVGSATGGAPTLQKILAAMTSKGYTIFTEPYRLNIVGVRDVGGEPNRFDDTINVFFKDRSGQWTFKSNPATTDPGTYYLLHPMKVAGTAIVVPGQYPDSHALGLHRKRYTALVQRGPITVVRDPDKDDRLDLTAATPTTGLFGINIHRATSHGTSVQVDKWSAGCQVFANSEDFEQFIEWCRHQSQIGHDRFTYTLLEDIDLV